MDALKAQHLKQLEEDKEKDDRKRDKIVQKAATITHCQTILNDVIQEINDNHVYYLAPDN